MDLVRLCQIADFVPNLRLINFEDIDFLLEFGSLWRTGRSHRDGARTATDPMVGAVHESLWLSRAALSLRSYVKGVFSDSERKSMQAMLARVTEPVAYQAFQHFITHAPWEAERVWRRLRAVLPERRGVLILDGTSFPKQGPALVGVARQVPVARSARSRMAKSP